MATIKMHPQLKGWEVTDAGGAIGMGRAIQAMGKQGAVQVVGLDDLPGLLVGLVLWQRCLDAPPNQRIDNGIAVLEGRALESEPARTP